MRYLSFSLSSALRQYQIFSLTIVTSENLFFVIKKMSRMVLLKLWFFKSDIQFLCTIACKLISHIWRQIQNSLCNLVHLFVFNYSNFIFICYFTDSFWFFIHFSFFLKLKVGRSCTLRPVQKYMSILLINSLCR